DMTFGGAVTSSVLTSLFGTTLGLVNSILVARLLGPSQRGTFSAVLVAATTISMFATLGLAGSNTVVVGRHPEARAAVVGQSLWVSLAAGFFSLFMVSVSRFRVVIGVDDRFLLLLLTIQVALLSAAGALR